MSFKLPKLVNKRCSLAPSVKAVKDVVTFDYNNLSDMVEIGRGSFAVVAAARYNSMVSAPKEVVIKKMIDLEEEEKDLFLKEVKLLHSLKHPNIVTFHGMCISPPAIMLEYMYFDFSLFTDRHHKVHSLKEFLFELSGGDPNEFAHVMPVIANDVAKGLGFLHENGVVHRDLKPANVLVSNHHYRDLVDFRSIEEAWSTVPVICKLTDFGEARSQLINTRNFKVTATNNVNRGTPAFMAPELLLSEKEQQITMSLTQLKKVDIWALGLLYFCVVNPGLSSAYTYEFQKEGIVPGNHMRHVKCMMRGKQLPSTVPEYEPFQSTTWRNIVAAIERCLSFQSEQRPTASDVLDILSLTPEGISHENREEEQVVENSALEVCFSFHGRIQENVAKTFVITMAKCPRFLACLGL